MPPVRGRELKPLHFPPDFPGRGDAPCAGARIETGTRGEDLCGWKMPPVRGRELKL